MNKNFYLLCLVIGAAINCFAVTKVWNVNGNGAPQPWNGANNWSPNGVPTINDDVVFNGSSNRSCDFNSNGIQMRSLTISSTYNGTVNCGNQAGILVTGDFVQSGGTFIAPGGTSFLTLGGWVVFNGGTFNSNGGIILLEVGSLTNINGPIVFSILQTKSFGSVTQHTLNFGNCIVNELTLDINSQNGLWSYQGNVNIVNFVKNNTNSNTSLPAGNTGTFTFIGTSAGIIGSLNAGVSYLPNMVINTSGNLIMNGHLNLQGNWTVTNGPLSAGTSTTHFFGPSSTISGAAAAFHNLSIENGTSLTFPATEVNISGDLVKAGSGNFLFQALSSIGLNGTTAQAIDLSGATLAAINGYSTGTRIVTLNGSINVTDSISAQTNVTLNTGGNLTLKASANLKGRVGRLSGTVTGNVTLETFIPGSTTGWANLGINGLTAQTVSDWDGQIPMTCVGCIYDPSTAGGFQSIQEWDEVSDSYISAGVTPTTNLTPGKGFWVFVGSGLTTTTDFILSNSGLIKQGAGTIPITQTGANVASPNFGCNLIANPYPSPISWSKLYAFGTNSNIVSNAIYVWNTDLAGGAGAMTSYVQGASSPGGGAIGDDIPAGQGFYVDASGGSGSGNLTYNESIKTNANTGSTPLLKTSSENDFGKIFRLQLNGKYDWDATVFRIHPNATATFDKKWDARKIFQSPGYVGYPGPYTHYTTISSKDGLMCDYSINSLPALTQSLSIPILVHVSTSGSYTMNVMEVNDLSMCIDVFDKLNNKRHDLRLSPYIFDIADTTSVPRFELILCKDESISSLPIFGEKAESQSIIITQEAQGIFVKTRFEQNTKATISVYTIFGQKLIDDIFIEGMVTNTPLILDVHNELVIIKVSSDNESVTKKIVCH